MLIAFTILVGIACVYGMLRIDQWNAWARLNPDAASLLFGGKSHVQAIAHMLTRTPPDRHSDLWK